MKNLEVELKNYKTFRGHDGARGINADIHYNGKKIATVYDDARGGEFDYNYVGKFPSKEYDQNKVLFSELMTEVSNLPKEYSKSLKMDFDQTLDSFISKLCSKLDQKKDMNKGVLVKVDWGYGVIGFGCTIPTAIKKYSNALTELQKIYDESIKADKEVLNAEYLSTQGVKI